MNISSYNAIKIVDVNATKEKPFTILGTLEINGNRDPEIDTTIEETKQYGVFTVLLNMVNITVLLSVNLGIMNMLPLPALDGGRLIFLLIEAVIRKPVPRKFEAIVHGAGIVALLLLSVFILINDITKFFR